jgi:class 3 adenylate cyclase
MQGTLVVINVGGLTFADQETVTAATVRYLSEGFLRDLGFTALASAVMIALLQLKRLHHAGEIWKLVTGRYHYPEEEELVFLFVDLAGSTTIAERLGHIGFSRMLRDMFADLSEPILAWKGRVYQHLGDGVIVTWTSAAKENAAAMYCFFDMVSQLQTHRDHYERIYGLVPTLRGAVHDGPVVTTWVGEAKKELAYHGDTLNVTARMQGSCKQLGVQLLVSERIRAGVDPAGGLSARPVGEVVLEGKEAAAPLYSVERVAPAV